MEGQLAESEEEAGGAEASVSLSLGRQEEEELMRWEPGSSRCPRGTFTTTTS